MCMFADCAQIFVLVEQKNYYIIFYLFTFEASTVFDAQDLGYRVILVEDACKGINPEKVNETIQSIRENNGLVINSREVNLSQPVLI